MDSDELRELLLAALPTLRDTITARIAVRAQQEINAFQVLNRADFEEHTRHLVECFLAPAAADRLPDATELTAYREFGVVRANLGVSVEAVLLGNRLAVQEILRELERFCGLHEASERVQLALTRQVIEVIDRAVLDIVRGHRDAELVRVRHDEQERADFIRLLLLTAMSGGERGTAMRRHGLDDALQYIPFRARSHGERGIEAAISALTHGADPVYATTLDGDLIGFSRKRFDLGAEVTIGFGVPARTTELHEAYLIAVRAFETAIRFSLTGSHDLDSLGLLPVVIAEHEIGRSLASRYLDPLERSRNAQLLRETLSSFLDSGLSIDTTADILFVHPNTVRYRLSRYREITGVQLASATEWLELWWALRYESLAH